MQQPGRILQFLGTQRGAWGVSALVVVDAADAAPSLKLFIAATVIRVSCSVPGHTATAWRCDFAIPQTAQSQVVAYTVGGQNLTFKMSAASAMPSMAYASCNGFSSASVMKSIPVPNALWSRMQRLHTLQDKVDNQAFGPYHLLLLGGDQIYSDAMWAVLPDMQA